MAFRGWLLFNWTPTVASLVLLAACTSSTTTEGTFTTSETVTVAPARPEVCPKHFTAKMLSKNDVPGMTHQLVPGSPLTLVICSPDVGDTPGRQTVIRDASELNRIVHALNDLPLMPQGTVSVCPLGYAAAEMGLFFGYRGGLLFVKIGPCPLATNGRRATTELGSVLRLLKHVQLA